MQLDLCKLHSVLSTCGAAESECSAGPAGGSSSPCPPYRSEVLLVVVRCCEFYEVIVVGLSDHRLLVRYTTRGWKRAEEAMVYEVPLLQSELECMTALDLSDDAEYLAIACEDALLIVVPLMELMCLHTPSGTLLETLLVQRERKRLHLFGREKGLEDPVKGALSSVAN
ncbi:unnamed protein product, partial [Polarella glacialis]